MAYGGESLRLFRDTLDVLQSIDELQDVTLSLILSMEVLFFSADRLPFAQRM